MQLVYTVYEFRDHLLFYLWWIKLPRKHSKFPKYYGQDWKINTLRQKYLYFAWYEFVWREIDIQIVWSRSEKYNRELKLIGL